MTPQMRMFIAGTALVVLAMVVWPAVARWWRRRQIRKELQLLRGGRPHLHFTSYGELAERPPRKPVVRPERPRGDHDAA